MKFLLSDSKWHYGKVEAFRNHSNQLSRKVADHVMLQSRLAEGNGAVAAEVQTSLNVH